MYSLLIGPRKACLESNETSDMAFLSYFRESREELKKVVWPTWLETRNNTMLVIGISLFVAAFLGLLDLGLKFLLNTYIIR